jgi:hypothetical protein
MFYLVKITINNVKFNLKLMSHIVLPYNQNCSLHRNEVLTSKKCKTETATLHTNL